MNEQRISCLACGSLESLNICPRCCQAYCSVKCYRSELHRECSEAFYRECIEREMHCGGIDFKQEQPKMFEQFMNEQAIERDIPMDMDMSGTSNQQEMLDSDDDDEATENSYLEKVIDGCMSEYQSIEERELDKQLTAFRIGIDNDKLLGALTDTERNSFNSLYEHLLQQETGLGRSVFTKKPGPN